MLLGARQFFERRGAPTPPLPYDAEVEYLESTGTQVIDTTIIPRKLMRVSCRFALAAPTLTASTILYFPFHSNTGRAAFGLWTTAKNKWAFAGLSSARVISTGVQPIDTNWHSATLSVSSDNASLDFDGNLIAQVTTAPTVFTHPITIFANLTRTNPGYGRISSLRVEDTATNQLLLDLIPVRKDGVGYMYDRVSGNLLGNGGTGAFTVGPDKS